MKQENKHFNANKWTNCQLEKRTIAALKKKNEMFALKHAEDTKEQLLDYIRKCAEEIGHTPCREEIIGGNFIAQRFGNWSIAVGMIGLPSPGYPPPLKTRKIYKDELKRQVKQRKAENRNTREERKAVRVEKSKIAQVEFEQKKKRDLEWGEEHKADTDASKICERPGIRARLYTAGKRRYRRRVSAGKVYQLGADADPCRAAPSERNEAAFKKTGEYIF